jgi:hypothetical protein
MPDGHERFKQTTAGCHTSALGELFIPDERRKAQGGIKKMIKFTDLVLGGGRFLGARQRRYGTLVVILPLW